MTDQTHEAPPVPRYLSRDEVAKRLGMKSVRSLSGIELPPPDVEVGKHKGWLPETIDAWHATRPGRGWWGGR
ncbi:helix-turn-helix DNA binding domain protein [Mycobacterium phage Roscoe]|uniref:Helix-turn-helix DNA binding domain protein n=123 Tax=Caudoviricetes TaxID=2731619 RepID=Q716N0_9CAUD|nr:DNA binding protein [Mycobacterium phage PG1]YP_008052122.1 DNA binding protein [Mycobacterium phage Newman]YP_009005692.1 DNA binding protein [Mycobacterium phage Suffolk]YP_009014306.1 DNA binding protein [Mycobacterium phage Oline]YP_009016834.1 DNA binding protein [Mycobacterium phage Vista]YP_009018358.1 DNA binding protein [Mycobacterium phage JacAttac]YP_009043319.1 DNA binding protein [Mycobacterium phage Manad]YP_009100854.1 DNA binding protein [Mycobacterium phage Soto]YP_00916